MAAVAAVEALEEHHDHDGNLQPWLHIGSKIYVHSYQENKMLNQY